MKPHLRHFMRTDRPATFSSAIWYFALQLGQRNFIQRSAVARWALVFEEAKDSERSRPRKAAQSLARGQKGALQKNAAQRKAFGPRARRALTKDSANARESTAWSPRLGQE